MEVFRDHGASTAELKTLNRCRLYFQAARTSDIATIAGTQLYHHVLPLERDQQTTHPMYPKSSDQWPGKKTLEEAHQESVLAHGQAITEPTRTLDSAC